MIDFKFTFKPWLFAGTIVLHLFTATPVLADAKADGDKGIEEYRKGNLIDSLMLLRSSAERGYAPAQVTLASILDYAEDNEEAFEWYQKAAEQNDAAGIYGMSLMYAKGEGIEKDEIKAGELIKQSADMQHLPAMRTLAHAFEVGNYGYNKNDSEAVQWYLKAAEAGDMTSMRRLIKAYSAGELGLALDADQAAEWERKHQISLEKQDED